LSACEAVWRILAFDIHDRNPSVERLRIHLKDHHYVVYNGKKSIEDAVNKPFSNTTKFLGWMEANKKYPQAKSLLYTEFPMKFFWKVDQHEWTPRKRGFSIGRVNFVPPGSSEQYYLRILINYQRGCDDYDDIKKVNNVSFPTFKDACYALGLLSDDKEYIDAIKEASFWATTTFLVFFLRHCYSHSNWYHQKFCGRRRGCT
jgi:hypothetical protein